MTFIMNHPELIKNPMLISGMKVAPATYISLVAFFVLQLIGLVLGLSGLFNSNVKKLFPILGTVLNGIFAVLTGIKI